MSSTKIIIYYSRNGRRFGTCSFGESLQQRGGWTSGSHRDVRVAVGLGEIFVFFLENSGARRSTQGTAPCLCSLWLSSPIFIPFPQLLEPFLVEIRPLYPCVAAFLIVPNVGRGKPVLDRSTLAFI